MPGQVTARYLWQVKCVHMCMHVPVFVHIRVYKPWDGKGEAEDICIHTCIYPAIS